MPARQVPAPEFTSSDGDAVQCLLCPRECLMDPGASGVCRGRSNRGGSLVLNNYARVTSAAIDPIEKKPLYHFHPGSSILSLGTFGCNLNCAFCQNWHISDPRNPDSLGLRHLPPEAVLPMVKRHSGGGCVGVAYTYSEPVVWYEYVRDTSELVSDAGFVNVLVTNAHLNERPWTQLLRHIDACNIDVKGFDPDFLQRVCGGDLSVVVRNVELAYEAGVHVEVTTLLVPDGTDDPDDLSKLSEWLAGVDEDIPLHLSRYYPHHRMQRPPTTMETMLRAREIAREKLNHVYLGNILAPGASDTLCPECNSMIVKRSGYRVRVNGLDGDRCAACGRPVNLIQSEGSA